MFKNRLKEKIKNGETVLGSFITCNSADLVEVMALSGFDFLVIDTEHGPLSIESSANLIRATELRGITPIIRVTKNSEALILRSLDIGAHGVQVPQINCQEAAERVIGYSKYFPIGKRGLALPRSSDYGELAPLEYFEEANRETMIIVHCENKEALDNIEEIAKLPFIDVIFLGPFDMSQSMGIPAQVHHSLIEGACKRVVQVCKEYNKAPGIFVMDGEQAKVRAEQGFQYITIAFDTILLAKACKSELTKLK